MKFDKNNKENQNFISLNYEFVILLFYIYLLKQKKMEK